MQPAISPDREVIENSRCSLGWSDGQHGNSTIVLLAFAALSLGLLWRLPVGTASLLWLDESFTAVIATQTTFSAAIAWTFHDPGEPLYYSFMWVWAHLLGTSDWSLRLPSFLFSLGAPVFLAWKGHPDRDTRLCWASLAALWLPGMYATWNARCYALLFLLACIQTAVFIRLLRSGTSRMAWLWSISAALLILCHYHSLISSGLEGLIYLFLRKNDLRRTWPAALVFLPVAVWVTFHLPHALAYGRADTAWYNTLHGITFLALPAILFGMFPFGWTFLLGWPLLLATTGTWIARGWRDLFAKKGNQDDLADTATVIVGLLSIAIVFTLGFIKPSFNPRYLTPYIPSLLLGIVLWSRDFLRSSRKPMIWLMAIWIVGTLILWNNESDKYTKSSYTSYNFVEPTRWLEQQGAKRVIFLWDTPNASLVGSVRLAQLIEFFFQRDKLKIPVTAVIPDYSGMDPNILLSSRANGNHDAIIWSFDTDVKKSLGIAYPPRFEHIDPRWTCHNSGKKSITVLACIHR